MLACQILFPLKISIVRKVIIPQNDHIQGSDVSPIDLQCRAAAAVRLFKAGVALRPDYLIHYLLREIEIYLGHG